MAIVAQRKPQTARALQVEYFSDFLSDFDVDPVKQDLYKATNEEAVKSSIRNLLLTNAGDRIYDSKIGSNIRSILFENFSPAMDSVLEDLIRTTIENYEPRAKINQVFVNSEIDSHYIVATIVFSIINKEEPITLELFLNRIR